MLQVWVDDVRVGSISPHGPSGLGMTFSYLPGTSPDKAVSLLMPPRAASYDTSVGLLPVFDMNLPEGALRDRVHNALSKEVGRVTELDILGMTGGHQIGRIRVLPDGHTPKRRPEIGPVDSLLRQNISPEFIESTMQRFALDSGVSGVMPKILAEDRSKPSKVTDRITTHARDWILKFGDGIYPGLPIVEHYCMEVMRRSGIDVAETYLSDDGHMIAIRRFDEVDGTRLGFEDFASLNGKKSKEKYIGSIETALFKRISEVSSPASRRSNLKAIFGITMGNMMMRNGDAHLKNFGVLFKGTEQDVKIAPAYDIVTTCAWIKDDKMALTLEGNKNWPDKKKAMALTLRARLSDKEGREIMEDIAQSMREVLPEMEERLIDAGHPDVAAGVKAAWTSGLESFGFEADEDHALYPAVDGDYFP